MKEKVARFALAALLLSPTTMALGCDQEDVNDAEQVGRDVREGAEDVGKEVESQIDKFDKDGKDD